MLETQYFSTGHISEYVQREARRGRCKLTYRTSFHWLHTTVYLRLLPTLHTFSKVIISSWPPTQSVDAGVGKPQPEGQIQPAACFQRPGCPGPQAGPVLQEGLQETACKAGSLYCLVLDRESVLSLALGKLHSIFLPQSTRVLKVS